MRVRIRPRNREEDRYTVEYTNGYGNWDRPRLVITWEGDPYDTLEIPIDVNLPADRERFERYIKTVVPMKVRAWREAQW